MFDINKFDKKAFDKSFALHIKKLGHAEKVTKETLAVLSRDVLAQLHTNEDIRPINSLLAILTPVNRKVVVQFFVALGGFKLEEESQVFSSKNKGQYDKKRTAAAEFLANPENNVWTWADRNIEVQPKEFKLESVTKGVVTFFEKAQKANIDRSEVLKAIIAGGIKTEELVAIMGQLAQQEAAANDAKKDEAKAA